MNICNTCGLPKDLCVCEAIAKESQALTVSIIKKKFGKEYTLIEGINESDIDIKELAQGLEQAVQPCDAHIIAAPHDAAHLLAPDGGLLRRH